jgi:hypothetical protein
VTLRDPDIAPTPPLDYVVRDRMGKVVQNHATPGGASLAVSRLDPGAFVAKGTTILGWHPATSKSQQREIRKLIGWPEPAPEFVPGAPPTPGHRTGIAFGAGARKPKVASGPPPATQPTPIATETTMATATKSETKPLCRKCQKRPVQPSRKNAKPETVGLCKQCKIALYPSQIAKTKAPKAKAPPARVKEPRPAEPIERETAWTMADGMRALRIIERFGSFERAERAAALVASLIGEA